MRVWNRHGHHWSLLIENNEKRSSMKYYGEIVPDDHKWSDSFHILSVLNHSFITYPCCTHLSQTNHAIEWHLVSQSASCLADSSNASPAKNGARTSLRPTTPRANVSVVDWAANSRQQVLPHDITVCTQGLTLYETTGNNGNRTSLWHWKGRQYNNNFGEGVTHCIDKNGVSTPVTSIEPYCGPTNARYWLHLALKIRSSTTEKFRQETNDDSRTTCSVLFMSGRWN